MSSLLSQLDLSSFNGMEGGSSDFLAVADESVLVEILSKLPLKSIHRFRCVSKEWNALTRSSYFLDRHRLHSSRRLLLISSPSLANRISAGVSLLADEETAPSSLNVPFLPSDARWSIDFVGSSNGLVCCNQFLDRCLAATIVWNPVTHQYHYFHRQLGNVLENATRYPLTGFDFMHSSNVYKLVAVELFGSDDPDDPLKIYFSVNVFTQGTPSWRVVESTFELGSCKMCYTNRSITVNGVLYWLVKDTSSGFAVVSFSLHDEEFNGLRKFVPEEIRYNDPNEPPHSVSWRNSLAVVDYDQGNNYVVWVDSTADQESYWTEEVRFKRPSIDDGH